MPHGGKRRGSGRKAGAVTVKTRAIADRAAVSGITPLEVMLDNMRFYHEAAGVALERLLSGSATPSDIIAEHAPKQLDPENQPTPVDAVKLILELRQRSGDAAKDAAPYIHARLATVEANAKPDDSVPLAERIRAYEQEDAIKASDGKVVALKKR